MPAAAGGADADARVVEPHAQPLPAGGDEAGGRAARLVGAVPGAAHHDGAARTRGEPVRAGPGAQGWGGHLKPSGLDPTGCPLPATPGAPDNTPRGPQTTLFSADSTPGGLSIHFSRLRLTSGDADSTQACPDNTQGDSRPISGSQIHIKKLTQHPRGLKYTSEGLEHYSERLGCTLGSLRRPYTGRF